MAKENLQKVIEDDLRMQELAKTRVFIFQQKVPRDGHGPVLIFAENFQAASGKLIKRFDKKYPKVSKEDRDAFFRNYSYRSYLLKPDIVLDYHGI